MALRLVRPSCFTPSLEVPGGLGIVGDSDRGDPPQGAVGLWVAVDGTQPHVHGFYRGPGDGAPGVGGRNGSSWPTVPEQ